jgi:2-haloacid dehalogenase
MDDLPLIVLETMAPTFKRIFGEKYAMRLWFANLILYSAALTMAGGYVPFTDIGGAVMKMMADARTSKSMRMTRESLRNKQHPRGTSWTAPQPE